MLMSRFARAVAFSALALQVAACAQTKNAQWNTSVKPRPTPKNIVFLNIDYSKATKPPYGFVQFCKDYPSECSQKTTRPLRAVGDVAVNELDVVNRGVNKVMTPITDKEKYGVEEYWTFASDGDCEDYVVLKRNELIRRGWPASALLITVVIDENNDGHAVLLARTKQGDFVLDNKTDDLRHWNETGYAMVMVVNPLDASKMLDVRHNNPSSVGSLFSNSV